MDMESKTKKKCGRKSLYAEPTVVLSIKVPISEYHRLKSLIKTELNKVRIQN
jgi:hypothetical protein